MRRIHAFTIAVVLAGAALAGLFAATRTTQLGAAAHARVPTAQIAKRNRQLDKIEKALLAETRRGPEAQSQPRQGVVYVRPKPIVHVVHRKGGEHEASEGESERDD
jgi:hypothetical protein